MTDEHSVYQFFADGKWELVESFMDLQTAVRTATALSTSVSAKIGLTSRVIVLDAMGFTSFEWIRGRGLVFPTTDRRKVEVHSRR
jgi:hypothetical protein